MLKYFNLPNSSQLPTSRPVSNPLSINTSTHFRFLYLSHISSSKGIDALLAIAPLLPENVSITVAGSLKSSCYFDSLNSVENINYKGQVQFSDTRSLFPEHPSLILPTHYIGEGYPGCIVEAFSFSLPVVSTRWRSIPEIVQHNYNGLLSHPFDYLSLLVNMISLSKDPTLYKKLSRNSYTTSLSLLRKADTQLSSFFC